METTGNNVGIGGSNTGIGDPTGTAARKLDQAAAGAHRVIDKASDAARPAVDRVASSVHQAIDKLAGAATQAAETLDEKSVKLKDAQSRLTENCRTYVQENPMMAVGIAVAAGFVLSKLLSSSR